MGGWWSTPEPIGGMKLRVILAGLEGSGKSHFVRTALGYGEDYGPTDGMPDLVTEHNKNDVYLKEIGSVKLKLDLFRFFAKESMFPKHCLYFFLSGRRVCHEIYTAQQWFFEAMLRLPPMFPVCVFINVRPGDRGEKQLTRADVKRILRLDIAAIDRPILLLRSTFDSRKIIERVFDWTFRNALFKPLW